MRFASMEEGERRRQMDCESVIQRAYRRRERELIVAAMALRLQEIQTQSTCSRGEALEILNS